MSGCALPIKQPGVLATVKRRIHGLMLRAVHIDKHDEAFVGIGSAITHEQLVRRSVGIWCQYPEVSLWQLKCDNIAHVLNDPTCSVEIQQRVSEWLKPVRIIARHEGMSTSRRKDQRQTHICPSLAGRCG
jgi:hypothetical protein